MSHPSRQETKPDPAEAMRGLRLRTLTSPPTDLGFQPTNEFPKVYGVLAEFPLSTDTVTVVSLRDGNASLYTTGTFGIIGGIGHESVRAASTALVKAAQDCHDEAATTNEFPYPKSDRVRFYLLTYTGVRFIDTDLASLKAGTNKYSVLFAKANDVITELRKITEK